MFIFMVSDDNFTETSNARLGRVFSYWNSVTGGARFRLTTFLYSYMCGNRMPWGAKKVRELQIVHRGEAFDRFRNLALPRLSQYVENWACHDTVNETVS